MSIHEECGVFGVISPKPVDVANISYYGLYALQHRGQESCGIVVNDDGVFVSHKDLGLVGDVFSNDILSSLPSGTMRSVMSAMAQPAEQTEITVSRLKSTTRKDGWRLRTTVICQMPPNSEMNWNYPVPFSTLRAIRKQSPTSSPANAECTFHRRCTQPRDEYVGRSLLSRTDVTTKINLCKRSLWFSTALLWADS